MIADPLWSCVMLLCGPLRYLVIPVSLCHSLGPLERLVPGLVR